MSKTGFSREGRWRLTWRWIAAKAAPTGLLIALLCGPALADYQAGLNAYSYGDYATAMKEWRAVTDGLPTAVNPAIYIEAHYAVAMLYWQGQGVPQDYEKAREWLLKAAEMNHAGAEAKLGYMYTDGLSVPQDLQQAFDWFGLAARQGDVDGQYNLGIFYLNGWGTAQDLTMAKQYLAAAAAQGDPLAEEALQRLLSNDLTARAGDFPFTEPEAETLVVEAEESPIAEGVEAEPAASPDEESTSVDAESRAMRAPTTTESDGAEGGRIAADGAESRAERAPTEVDTPVEEAAPIEEATPTEKEALTEEQALTAEEAPMEEAVPPELILGEDWIMAREPEHYTIQVMALGSREKIEEVIASYDELAPFAIYTVPASSGVLYVLVQGDYADVDAARAARDAFPRRIQRRDDLWIRKFGMVQRLVEQ